MIQYTIKKKRFNNILFMLSTHGRTTNTFACSYITNMIYLSCEIDNIAKSKEKHSVTINNHRTQNINEIEKKHDSDQLYIWHL